jgi:outer membrane protein assembly complex protein YaeT
LTIAALGFGGLRSAAAQAVAEGLVVRQLSFKGNRSFDKTTLSAAIATTESTALARIGLLRWIGLGSKRHLSERALRMDTYRLRLFYQVHGFLDAKVDTTVVRTPKDVYITFHIDEGQPVLVRSFEIKGLDSLPFRDEILDRLPLRVQQPFDRTLLLATADSLILRLQNRGYPEARVLLEKRDVNREERVADVSFLVEPGIPAVIGHIHVEGTETVDSNFVRALLATEPGRPFEASDLALSQQNLYRSELFRFATVRLDTADFKPGSGVVPITIVVTEGLMHRARAAAGYGTNDCFRLGLGWTARNALGHGQVFDVSAQASKLGVGDPTGIGGLRNSICSALKDDSIGSTHINYNLTASFRRPLFITAANTLTLSLFAERRSEFLVYLREDIGGSVTLVRETQNRIPISLTYRLSLGRTEANNVSFCAFFNACTDTDIRELRERRLLATATLGAKRTRVDNPLDPSEGNALSVELTHSSRLIGSSKFAVFTRLVGDAAQYFPLGGSVLALHLRSGIVLSPELALAGGRSNFVPPEQRFYAGGPNDVRGYSRNELGPLVYVVEESNVTVDTTTGETVPKDPTQVRSAATGGNSLIVANAELRVPSPLFRRQLRFAAFVDGGSVWERGQGSAGGPSFRITPGVGIRFQTLLGPARLDVAYNRYDFQPGRLYLIHPSGSLELLRNQYQRPRSRSSLVFQFGVGQAF